MAGTQQQPSNVRLIDKYDASERGCLAVSGVRFSVSGHRTRGGPARPPAKESVVKRTVAIVLALMITASGVWAQQPLRVTRVLLYKNGMAYIVRTGQLAAPLNLTFHPEDMNDILKSFSAWNPDTGALYSVGYTAGIPASRMLARYPFNITDARTGLGGFLVQVKGADVRLDQGGRNLEGKLVAVQEAQRVTAPQTSSADYRLTVLLRDSSLQTAWLSDVRSVEFADAQLREQLRSYLEVLAAGRQDVTKEISVYPVPAPGPIQVAYLQQFPLWKTSYRVDLGAQEGRIQGWAQIDNPTGEAWEDVTVSLLSGAPVSFQMNLYEPLYTTRTTVAVPGRQVAAPRQYEAAISASQGRMIVDGMLIQGSGGRAAYNADIANAQTTTFTLSGSLGESVTGGTAINIVPRTGSGATFQPADTSRIEDLYEYKFPFPVRIASRQSALLPFLQKSMPIERLSIFNASSDRGNPRLGVRIENNTDIPFEAGPATFFADSRYAGEAVLDYLPRGEKSLVSFGVDYELQIAARADSQPETIARLTVANGVAVRTLESSLTTTYEIRNKGTESKSLIIEHPRFMGRTLKDLTPFETTAGFYRFRVALTPGQSTTLAVPEVVARQISTELTELTRPQLRLFSGGAMPAGVREQLEQIVGLQEQVSALDENLSATQAEIDTQFSDQVRLRENLKALGTGAGDQQLRRRYLGQLRKQEDQIDAARARIASLKLQVVTLQTRVSEAIANLTWK